MGDNRESQERPTATRRAFLSASAVTAAAAVPLVGASPAQAHGRWTDPPVAGPGRGIGTQRPSAALRRALREVDADRIEADVRRLAAFGTRHTLSTQTDPARGIGAARDWLFEQFSRIAERSGGRMTVEKQSFTQPVSPRVPTPTVITNVIATLRGTVTPERVYVLTGHYDSRISDVMNFTDDAPGADDDASGVAILLELARVLADRPLDATLVLGAVAGEEQGLYGSAYMAQQFKDADTDIQGMFSNDIVGASRADDGTREPRVIRLFAEGVPTSETPAQGNTRRSVGGENDSASRQLARFVDAVADNDETGMHVRVIWRRDRYLRGSDHISFLERGYPAGRFTEPNEDFRHQHQDVRVEDGVQFGDLPEFCDFDFIARVARVNLATVWSLSQGPGTPKGVIIVTTNLTNDTQLRWQANTEPDVAGYEVVWRETREDDWTHVIDAGDVTEAIIDLSKDNVFFGVRAYDRDGHRSPVAFPVPGT
ncbi:M28 family metallopeptidase [Asanoa sp. WMMD1127]|uniref:M28 family metallopeptidase n=1 Tax=Asanoa sp. WMMD1127 TaxID=3016107 RepID=UPI002415F016|nr:M28 family metallopeptidase [Asanoa sp. WMMD1127]MDG4823192.1 M28 family metallopeptidase [Asanoa sp. WMMD1127]